MHRPADHDTIDMREHQLLQQQAQAAGPSSTSSSLFFLRNPLAAASRTMRRGIIRGFCHGVASTSTQHHQLAHGSSIHEEDDHQQQRRHHADAASSSFLTVPSSCGGAETESEAPQPQLTLEQMILQLDLEEAKAAAAAHARKERRCSHHAVPRRMSCVDRGSADHVLRDALSQYPRFSLDGRDAAACRASFSSYHDAAAMGLGCEMDWRLEGKMPMPDTVGGESVVWCETGVVAKLMGLDSVPVPVRARPRGAVVGAGRRKARGPPPPAKTTTGSGIRKEIRPRRMGREELEKERLFMALHGYGYGYDVMAEAGACHAGGQLRTAVGPTVSRFGREGVGHGWEFRFPS
ncbi:uncharacterized protein LOC112270895 [Brachypodium distachyon]|uniref:DUF3741 domain-containing protein n=1 Tax=Brachypodium distachyon TaxID=15368 RepID=A0A0Q3ITG3_BRADI|nr:uncharacterized protein LOC112270895 [Brachypodium distachyon]KQK03716.2 hypothetical protein BRADI_2g09460v3 [Brachypodium distachyon]|eukprot:XP_024315249.1 uncharacterized protein LOC112270895 [Brachypodium distachyon]